MNVSKSLLFPVFLAFLHYAMTTANGGKQVEWSLRVVPFQFYVFALLTYRLKSVGYQDDAWAYSFAILGLQIYACKVENGNSGIYIDYANKQLWYKQW